MPSYKLTYFPIRALGEPIHLMFAYGDVEYEEKTITFDAWKDVKPNLKPDTEMECAMADMVADCVEDMRTPLVMTYVMKREGNDEKHEFFKRYIENIAPNGFANLEKMKKRNKGFWVGNKMTWVDIYVASTLETFCGLAKENDIELSLDKYPILKAHQDKVFAQPAIKARRDARPDAPF